MSSNSSGNTHTDEDDQSSFKYYDYYHGIIQRQDAEELLKNNGDFLLRVSEKDAKNIMIISVRFNNKLSHVVINTDGSNYWFCDRKETCVDHLIAYHINNQVPITKTSGAILKNPVEFVSWIIDHEDIVLSKKLGEGAFGEVYLAECTVDDERFDVAVKTMRVQLTRESRSAFMKEARLMRKYNHPNIVRIIGIAVHAIPLMIVMEMCPHGSLLSHLRKNNTSITTTDRIRFCIESADGLGYLERQKCIHRDIAARNCLLSSVDKIKISDFGLSDDKTTEMHDDTLSKVPIKWLAPEVLQEKLYSLKSDVWAFGILMWEIYADGSDPYPGMSNIQTRAKIVCNDYRMPFPDICPHAVRDVALKMCWPKMPNDRATMSSIHKRLIEVAGKQSFLKNL